MVNVRGYEGLVDRFLLTVYVATIHSRSIAASQPLVVTKDLQVCGDRRYRQVQGGCCGSCLDWKAGSSRKSADLLSTRRKVVLETLCGLDGTVETIKNNPKITSVPALF